MGIRDRTVVFLRPPYRGGKDRTGRPGSRVKEIGFERYPSFQNRDAHALRFGSMNPISRAWAHGSMGGKTYMVEFCLVSGQKVII